MEKFKFLEHQADIKFRAQGKTINEAFENAVLAVSSYLSQDKKVKKVKKKLIEISSNDNESLLYQFVDEIIYLLDAEKFIPSQAKVNIESGNLRAEILGDDSKNYNIKQIKAATYADIYVKKVKDGKGKKEVWEIQMVLDV
jgi:SHS2 domain-containing protein